MLTTYYWTLNRGRSATGTLARLLQLVGPLDWQPSNSSRDRFLLHSLHPFGNPRSGILNPGNNCKEAPNSIQAPDRLSGMARTGIRRWYPCLGTAPGKEFRMLRSRVPPLLGPIDRRLWCKTLSHWFSCFWGEALVARVLGSKLYRLRISGMSLSTVLRFQNPLF